MCTATVKSQASGRRPAWPLGRSFRRARHGERQRHHLSGEGVVVRVNQLDLHLVLAGGQPGYVDGVVVTRIRPPPGQVVDGDVQMPDTWRDLEGGRPEHGCDAHVLHAVLGPEDALGQPLGKWGSTISLGAGSFSIATYGEAPRMSLALWAKALVARTVPAATTASVLMSMVIAVSPFEHRLRLFGERPNELDGIAGAF